MEKSRKAEKEMRKWHGHDNPRYANKQKSEVGEEITSSLPGGGCSYAIYGLQSLLREGALRAQCPFHRIPVGYPPHNSPFTRAHFI